MSEIADEAVNDHGGGTDDPGLRDEQAAGPAARRHRLRSVWTVGLAALMAAVATLSFGLGTASAQTSGGNSDSTIEQADSGTDDSGDDGTCDREGSYRGGKLWRLGASDTLTEVLGIDAETLRTKLKDGSTLADIAAEQGVEASDIVDALVTAITERAAEHDREIDGEELSTKITAFVNGEKPERPEGEDGWKGRRGHHRGSIGDWGRWGGRAHADVTMPSASTTAAQKRPDSAA